MSQIANVGGVGVHISGGRTLINGTGYDILGGRTLAGGTGYDIDFVTKTYTITVYANPNDMYATYGQTLYNVGVRWAEFGAGAPDSAGWVSSNTYVFSGVKPGSRLTAEAGFDPRQLIDWGSTMGFASLPEVNYNGEPVGSFYDPTDGSVLYRTGAYYYYGTIYYNTYTTEVTSDLVVYAIRHPEDRDSYLISIQSV